MAKPFPRQPGLQTSSRDPESWTRFRQRLRGACWYLSSLHSQLQERLPHSHLVRQLGGDECSLLSPGYRPMKQL